jgi:hypothetical protein
VADENVKGPNEVSIFIGEVMRILRTDLEPTVVRQLMSANGVLEFDREAGGWRGMRVGETTFSLIPNIYDVNRALTIQVHVTNASD